ncbi:MAG: hypothetical protein AAF458_03310 [Pseudomonadota bacterium]
MVQQKQAANRLQSVLQKSLTDFIWRNFRVQASIIWMPITAGNGFTAGLPSKSSVVSLTAPEPLARARRAELLRALCDVWTQTTDGRPDELVAVISDPSTAGPN